MIGFHPSLLVHYLNAARYASLDTARAAFVPITEILAGTPDDQRVGVNVVVWQSQPIVIVHALDEIAPEIEQAISSLLINSGGEIIEPHSALVDAVVGYALNRPQHELRTRRDVNAVVDQTGRVLRSIDDATT